MLSASEKKFINEYHQKGVEYQFRRYWKRGTRELHWPGWKERSHLYFNMFRIRLV